MLADVVPLARLRVLVSLVKEILDTQTLAWLTFSMRFSGYYLQAHGGIPEKPGLRALCWKLLLGYLPPQRAQWEEWLQKQRLAPRLVHLCWPSTFRGRHYEEFKL